MILICSQGSQPTDRFNSHRTTIYRRERETLVWPHFSICGERGQRKNMGILRKDIMAGLLGVTPRKPQAFQKAPSQAIISP